MKMYYLVIHCQEYQLPENTIRLINELNTLLESKQPSTQSTTQTHHNHNVFEKHWF